MTRRPACVESVVMGLLVLLAVWLRSGSRGSRVTVLVKAVLWFALLPVRLLFWLLLVPLLLVVKVVVGVVLLAWGRCW